MPNEQHSRQAERTEQHAVERDLVARLSPNEATRQEAEAGAARLLQSSVRRISSIGVERGRVGWCLRIAQVGSTFMTRSLGSWMARDSRSKNRVASLACIPAMTANVAAAALLAVGCWSLLAGPVHAQSGPTAANYQLLTPKGAGPFPAVVVLHGCSGIDAKLRRWAGRLSAGVTRR